MCMLALVYHRERLNISKGVWCNDVSKAVRFRLFRELDTGTAEKSQLASFPVIPPGRPSIDL